MAGSEHPRPATDRWIDAAERRGMAVVVVDAPSGYGKSLVLQTLYDDLADGSEDSYWSPGLAPTWPPTSEVALERSRKAMVPPDALRDPSGAANLGFVWLGLAMGEIDDGGPIDPDSMLLSQLGRLRTDRTSARKDEIQLERRREARRGTMTKVGRTAAGLVPGVPAAIEVLGTIADATADGAGVVGLWRRARQDPSLELRAEAERQVHDLIREVTTTDGGLPCPVVLAIDDIDASSGAAVALLELITGVSVEEGAGWQLLPAHGAPVLVVVARGSASSSGAAAFDAWMEVAAEALAEGPDPLEVPVATFEVSLDPLPRARAEAMLRSTPSVPPTLVRPVLDHLAAPRAGAAVNPLVLAEAVCKIRDWVAQAAFGAVDLDALVPTLATAPTTMAVRRLEHLHDEPGGDVARGLLSQLAQWGPIVPIAVAEALLDERLPMWSNRIDELLDLLQQHGLAGRLAEPATYPILQIQIDLHRFLVSNAVTDRAVASVARRVCDELLIRALVGDGDPAIPSWLITDAVRTAARLDPLPSYAPVTTDLSAPADEAEVAKAASWWFAGEPRAGLDDAQVIRLRQIVASTGRTSWASTAAIGVARYVPLQFARETLEPLARLHKDAAIALADLDPAHALEILGGWEEVSADVAVRVAPLDPDRAEELLRPWAGVDVRAATLLAELRPHLEAELVEPLATKSPEAAMWLADRHPERAVELLVDWARAHGVVALRLATLRPELADELLEPHAATDHQAALRLAALHPERADELLADHAARFAHAAVRLANLHPERAEELLERFVDASPDCAHRLAELRPDRAVDLMERWAVTEASAALRLHALDPERGARYLSRHESSPQVAILLSRAAPERAIELLDRHRRDAGAMAALADLAPQVPPLADALKELGSGTAAVEAVIHDADLHPALRVAATGALTCARRDPQVPIPLDVGVLDLYHLWRQAWTAGFAAAARAEEDRTEAWWWASTAGWPETWQQPVLAATLARRAVAQLAEDGPVDHWDVDELVASAWPSHHWWRRIAGLTNWLRDWSTNPYRGWSPWATIDEVLSVLAVARSLEHLLLEERPARWWTIPHLDRVEERIAARLGPDLPRRAPAWSTLCPELFLAAQDQPVHADAEDDLTEDDDDLGEDDEAPRLPPDPGIADLGAGDG